MSPYVWLGIAAVMGIVEVISFGLITVWFVIGGLAAFFVGFAGADLIWQIIVFLVVSVLCLILLRPLVMQHRASGGAHSVGPMAHEPTLVGQYAVAIETINNAALTGRVETPDHMTWAALSADGSIIKEGANVRIVGQQSIKLIVEPI